MILKVFHTRVELQDNVGNTMAVLAFPEVSEGVCEMHDIYLNVDEIKDNARNKMITYALVQIRKNNWQVIPAGPETSEWFDTHPSDCDLLRSAANPAPVQESEPVAQTEETASPVSETIAQGTQAVAQQTKRAASTAIRVFARFLQVLTAACMIGIIGLFGWNWVVNRSIAYWMFAQTDQLYWFFLLANAVFVFFCVVFLFWMMSRRVYYYDDRELHVDTGRGMTAFILVLLAYGAAFVGVRMFGYMMPSLVEYVQLFFTSLTTIPVLALAGLAFCILRKIICR